MEGMEMNPAFWKGRRVFITGHTGFKGSWLSIWLQSMGADLTGYALPPPTSPSLFEEAKVATGMKSIIGDIRDQGKLLREIQRANPEIVIHMAAQPLVRFSYNNPVETYAINLMGTVHLLEAVRNTSGVKAVLNVTTDKCYENREWLYGYRENDPMGGYDPYSSSKGCSELATSAYRTSYFNANNFSQHGVALATARAGNVIGGGDWAKDRLIPDILIGFESGAEVRIRNPNSIRPWQYVLEPLFGYLLLVQRLYEEGSSYAEGWNFSSDNTSAKTVGWIVQRLAELWGGDDVVWKLDNGSHPHEAEYLKLDCSKTTMKLKWHSALSLDETLERIVHWHKVWLSGVDIKSYSLTEIYSYMDTRNSRFL